MKPAIVFQNILVEIATPHNVGMGFISTSHQLIITNEHIVTGNQEVVITSAFEQRTFAKVLYTDAIYDLAFIELPANWNVPPAEFAKTLDINDDDAWLLNEVKQEPSIQTRILTHELEFDDITYIEFMDVINSSISGSPLLNRAGEIIGMTTAISAYYTEGGFALSIFNIKKIIEVFQNTKANEATRCLNCKTIVSNLTIKNQFCPDCLYDITLPSLEKPFTIYGISKTIEELITVIGHDPKLSRRGPNSWEIKEGSATIQISYYEKKGYIIGDAFLCAIQKTINTNLYQYLLKQNYIIEGLNFSIKEEDIVLSLLISERDLNTETGQKLFQHLFDRADYFDNILVEQYGAKWK